jgi:hypothetical protein
VREGERTRPSPQSPFISSDATPPTATAVRHDCRTSRCPRCPPWPHCSCCYVFPDSDVCSSRWRGAETGDVDSGMHRRVEGGTVLGAVLGAVACDQRGRELVPDRAMDLSVVVPACRTVTRPPRVGGTGATRRDIAAGGEGGEGRAKFESRESRCMHRTADDSRGWWTRAAAERAAARPAAGTGGQGDRGTWWPSLSLSCSPSLPRPRRGECGWLGWPAGVWLLQLLGQGGRRRREQAG